MNIESKIRDYIENDGEVFIQVFHQYDPDGREIDRLVTKDIFEANDFCDNYINDYVYIRPIDMLN